MLSRDKLEEINNTLLKFYGYLYEKPKYRLVWSSDAREYRYVDGNVFDEETGAYLCQIRKTTEVFKYPMDRDRYVLEILVEIPEQLKHELYGENGYVTYEPLWVFKKNGEYQEPTELAVRYLAYCSHNPVSVVLSPENLIYKLNKKDYEEVMMILDDAVPDLAAALKKGSAAFIDSTKRLVH
jgi:hypothetical protein